MSHSVYVATKANIVIQKYAPGELDFDHGSWRAILLRPFGAFAGAAWEPQLHALSTFHVAVAIEG